jgi:hypothetical protein
MPQIATVSLGLIDSRCASSNSIRRNNYMKYLQTEIFSCNPNLFLNKIHGKPSQCQSTNKDSKCLNLKGFKTSEISLTSKLTNELIKIETHEPTEPDDLKNSMDEESSDILVDFNPSISIRKLNKTTRKSINKQNKAKRRLFSYCSSFSYNKMMVIRFI